ncbi:MAG: hypothetical protein HY819_16645 [Acidobacteria bacterium]|nr:hypothetical protein [Acidobacteriota bacterium]
MFFNKNLLLPFRIICLFTYFIATSLIAISQISQIDSQNNRDVIRIDVVSPSEFAKNRVNPQPLHKKVTRRVVKTNSSKNAGKALQPKIFSQEEVAALGVTVWKLRPAAKDDSYRIIDIVGSEAKEEMTPQRVEGKAMLEDGSFFRLGLEIPTQGYLYVFNREQYENSYGKAYLIYPVESVNGQVDNNYASAGELFFLPKQKESYFFKLNGKGENGKLFAESFTVIVSEEPLNLSPIKCFDTGKLDNRGDRVIRCSPRLISKEEFDFEAKLKEWSSPTAVAELDLKNLTYKKYKSMDVLEIQALKGETKKLSSQAPPPQQIYTVLKKANQPYLVTIPVYIKNS